MPVSRHACITRDIFGHAFDVTYASTTRIIDEPAAALFQDTEATSGNTWQRAKVVYMGYKPIRADTCVVHLKVAANDTASIRLCNWRLCLCFDPNKSTFYIYGNSRTLTDLSDMAAAQLQHLI